MPRLCPLRRTVGLLLFVLASAASAAAHHSFAVFDHNQTVTVTGTVSDFRWTNPHGFLEVDYRAGDGTLKHYTIELTSINMLSRAAVTPPAPQPPPLKPQFMKDWQARQQAAREATAKGQPIGINWVNCLPDGMPGMMQGPFPMEVLQSKGQVTIIQESFTQVRRILLDRPQKALDAVDPSFYGHSVGRWEGDTLVVDTIGIKEEVRYQNVPHSDRMRIRERIRLVPPDVLWDEITVEDPVTLEKPWTFTFAYRRMPDYTLLEYICEDNREFIDDQGLQRMRLTPSPSR